MDNNSQENKKRKSAVDVGNDVYNNINSVKNVIQTTRKAISTIRSASILANPYFLVFAIILSIALWLMISSGGGAAPMGSGGGGSQNNQSGGGQQPGQSINGALDYYIPFRDSSINPVDLRSEIKQNWPNAKTENWDTIISFARQNGWNPAFLLALWIEESGAQGAAKYDDPLGCDPESPTTDINISLGCIQKSFGDFGNDRFDDLMCRYGGDGFHDAPCVFVQKNPNFPPVIKSWYQKLVPSGPGALVNITPTPLPGYSGTCPIQAGPITCGSNTNIINGCGHCNPDYGYKENMNMCTYDEIYYAEDVGAAAGTPVFFPSISGQSITWTNIGQSGSSIGVMIAYKGTSPSLPPGDTYWLRFHHVESGSGVTSGTSGQQAAKTCTTSSDCNHLHVEFAVDGTGGRRILDASTSFCR